MEERKCSLRFWIGIIRYGSIYRMPNHMFENLTSFRPNNLCLYRSQRGSASRRLVILADSGGSNGCRPRAWKYALQHRLGNAHGPRVTVTHFPTGCSKRNPIEHRLFSFISLNWAGRHPAPSGHGLNPLAGRVRPRHPALPGPTFSASLQPRLTSSGAID